MKKLKKLKNSDLSKISSGIQPNSWSLCEILVASARPLLLSGRSWSIIIQKIVHESRTFEKGRNPLLIHIFSRFAQKYDRKITSIWNANHHSQFEKPASALELIENMTAYTDNSPFVQRNASQSLSCFKSMSFSPVDRNWRLKTQETRRFSTIMSKKRKKRRVWVSHKMKLLKIPSKKEKGGFFYSRQKPSSRLEWQSTIDKIRAG